MKYLISFFILLLLVFSSSNLCAESWNEYLKKSDEYQSKKDFKNALQYAEKALEACKQELGENSQNYAIILGRIGSIYFSLTDYNSAIDYMIKEKEVKKVILGSNDISYAAALQNLCSVFQSLGRYREAEPLLLEAIEIKKQKLGENDSSYAKTLHSLAVNYQNLGKFKEAEELYLKSIQIKKTLQGENNTSYCKSLMSLAALYNTLGNNQEALKFYEQTRDLLIKITGEESPELIEVQTKLASLYLSLGMKEKAEPILNKIKDIQSQLGGNNVEYANTLFNLALIQWEQKNYPECEVLILKSKEMVAKRLGQGHPLYSACVNALGAVRWAQGDLEGAYNYFNEATYLKEKLFGENMPDFAVSLHNLAGIQKELGQFKIAEQNYRRAFSLYQKQIKNYFPFLSDNEKSRFYAKMREKFDMFNCYVLQRYKDNPDLIDEMYNYRLDSKAILLNSSKKVQKIIQESADKELQSIFIQWKNIKEDLANLYNLPLNRLKERGLSIDSLEKLANSLEKDISLKSAEFEQEYDKKVNTWLDVQKSLKKDEAAIEIIRFNFYTSGMWSDTIFYVALILTSETKDHPEIIIMDNGKDLESMYIKNYKNSILHKIKDRDSYLAFWKSIDEKIANKKNIFVSTDGVYNKLNISTLEKPDGKCIIDDYSVEYVTNTKDLIDRKSAPEKTSKFSAILFGFPKFLIEPAPKGITNSSIPELPGTKVEVTQIEEILKKHKCQTGLFTEKDASESNIKQVNQPRVLHIATHGYFKQDINTITQKNVYGVDITRAVENPLLRSGIMFAGAANYLDNQNNLIESGKEENGVLTAFEAMNLNLSNTYLVVLSACETGLGEIRNGEGVYGLQRAFQVAGAKNIIMSLWKVNDNATQELMTNFYQTWLEGKKINEAFRIAQAKLKEKYPNPFFWGAFVLIGCE